MFSADLVFSFVIVMSSLCNAMKQQAQQATNKKVAIIGAGAAGLCVGEAFQQESAVSSFTIFEASSSVGGVWKQTKPMYRSLVTNLPVEVMEISQNFPFKKLSGTSFVRHLEVNSYLEDFARDRDLLQHIKFDTKVTSIEPIYWNDADLKWRVSTSSRTLDTASGEGKEDEDKEEVDIFDNVVICNGHYSKPFTPVVPGVHAYTGRSLHSIDYDSDTTRQLYGGKRVLLLGARSSAMDIAREIAAVASSIYVSDRSLHLSDSVQQHYDGKLSHVGAVTCYKDGAFVFTDGSRATDVDVIVYCTGYEYDFPFFDRNSCHTTYSSGTVTSRDENNDDDDTKIMVVDQGRAVLDVYQHIFHHRYPSLAFVGLPWSVVPFHMFYLQALWIAKVFSSKDQSLLHTEETRQTWLTSHAG